MTDFQSEQLDCDSRSRLVLLENLHFLIILRLDELPICLIFPIQNIGAEVFFPDAEARRSHLLSLVEKVMEESKAVSLSYTFESLCRFFSNKDASGLLGLPEHLPQVL